MRIVKRKSKNVYTNSNGAERHYYNYYIECDNGKRILFKPVKKDDYAKLDMVCEYER